MLRQHLLAALVLPLALFAGTAVRAGPITGLVEGLGWGETSRTLLDRFGHRATVLPHPIDFGDSYAEIMLRDYPVGGVALTVFFQMDKTTRGLKRVQLERQGHGVNPPAYRAIVAMLDAEYGPPDAACVAFPGAAKGYQAAAERVWLRDGLVIRAIFRDTTIEAFEGCLDFGAPPCGLTGQLLVRVSPRGADASNCRMPAGS